MKTSRKAHNAAVKAEKLQAYGIARETVLNRSTGRCELCGARLTNTFHAHHRKLRSAGGPDCPCNLIALCGACHETKVHAHPQDSRDHGWIISRWERRPPSSVGMLLHNGMGFFTCGGEFSIDPTPALCVE